jgi:hypothetical protein
VEVTEADLSTKLSDLGAGTVVNAGDTVIVKNSNNEYHTITLGAESTLGDLMTGLSNAGLSAQVKNDGTIEITGGTITGGTFEGPKMKGTIIPGGADYQMSGTGGRTEIEAIYSIKTDDGVYIHVRNNGIISMGTGSNGAPAFYFRTTPKFEAPVDSKYAWLNNAVFVCAPAMGGAGGGITLNVWMVK